MIQFCFKIPLKKKKQNPKSERLNWLKKKNRERERASKRKKKKENGINKPKQGKLLRTF